LRVFRLHAGLGVRIARSFLLPYGPLVATIAVGPALRVGEHAFGLMIGASVVWFLCSLALVPALLFRGDSRPGPSDDDPRQGGGGPQGPPPRNPGSGGIPLPDAEQSRERVRDHVRRRRPWLRRRTAREPEPARRSPTRPA
jgi:hypothetical protein